MSTWPDSAEAVVCGAGIAGIAAAYFLSVHHGLRVVLVDERPPLSLTSDKSTECYRNWWPGPGDAMVALMNRSIDILEDIALETDNRINLNRRGYLFATADEARAVDFVKAAEEAAGLGAGAARQHRSIASGYQPSTAQGFLDRPIGSDVILDRRADPTSLSLSQRKYGGGVTRAALWLVQWPTARDAPVGASARGRDSIIERARGSRFHRGRPNRWGERGNRGRYPSAIELSVRQCGRPFLCRGGQTDGCRAPGFL